MMRGFSVSLAIELVVAIARPVNIADPVIVLLLAHMDAVLAAWRALAALIVALHLLAWLLFDDHWFWLKLRFENGWRWGWRWRLNNWCWLHNNRRCWWGWRRWWCRLQVLR
jgi:hypothetical protein